MGSDELSINVVIAGMFGAMILFFFGSLMTEGITITQALFHRLLERLAGTCRIDCSTSNRNDRYFTQ